MRDWGHRFAAMPDRQRAVLLLKIMGIALIVLLYLLGGASLYLRHRYLDVTPTPPVAPEATLPAEATCRQPATRRARHPGGGHHADAYVRGHLYPTARPGRPLRRP
jgi:hypothetical protein